MVMKMIMKKMTMMKEMKMKMINNEEIMKMTIVMKKVMKMIMNNERKWQ